MANPLKKQIGPLELWQWATVGVGIGGMILLLSKGKTSKGGVTPEQEEKLLGGLRSSGVGAGGESIPPPVNTAPVTPTPGEVGPPGIPGTAGEPGAPGSTAAEVAQELQPTLNSFQNQINNLGRHTAAPPKKKSTKHVAKKKGKPTKAQKRAQAHGKAHKEGKKAVAKPRGNHSAQTGKPNHSAAKPLSHRFSTNQQQAQNRASQRRAQQQHQAALRQQREKHEREKRERERAARERAAREAREAREHANKQRAVATRRRKK